MFAVTAGCYPSENPIWTPETLVYRPELLGVYQADEPAKAKNTTTLEKGEAEKSYRVVTRDGKGEKTDEGVLRIVQLGDSLFYDYQPSGAKLDKFDPPLKELHLFGRLTIKDKNVTLYHFGSNILVDEAFRWKEARREKEEARVIANTTKELQAFLKINAVKMNVSGAGFTKLHD
jgi:hypothetical protein